MTDDDIRRANIATCGVSPQRAAELLENMRPGVPEWPWMFSDQYGSLWLRLIEDVGQTSGYGTGPDFVAVQDWPCEPGARQRIGLTTQQPRSLTLRSYLGLCEQFSMVDWAADLAGFAPVRAPAGRRLCSPK